MELLLKKLGIEKVKVVDNNFDEIYDKYEQKERSTDSSHYRYSVKYDDGSFDTYVNQNNMKQL